MTVAVADIQPIEQLTHGADAVAPLDVQLYKVPDVMRMLRMSRSVVYEQISAGRLRTVKQGRATFITTEAIADYITLLKREAEEAVARDKGARGRVEGQR